MSGPSGVVAVFRVLRQEFDQVPLEDLDLARYVLFEEQGWRALRGKLRGITILVPSEREIAVTRVNRIWSEFPWGLLRQFEAALDWRAIYL